MISKIFGPPGCGKTTALLRLFEQELETVAPSRVAFLTFTRAAREEALSRSGRAADDLPYLRTIHSICYRELGVKQQQVIKPKQLQDFGKEFGIELTGKLPNPWLAEDLGAEYSAPKFWDLMLQLNHLGRHKMATLREMLDDRRHDFDFYQAKWFIETYRGWKHNNSLFDYTDLLTNYLSSGEPLDIDVLFVDEAQDLSRLQWKVVRKLGALAQRTYVAGDDDQAIFAWAGADPVELIDMKADKTEVLSQSYRLPQVVHSLAMRISSRIQKRAVKEFMPRAAQGIGLQAMTLDPSLFDEKTFILYRNHHRGQALAKQLMGLSVPFHGTMSPLSDDDVRHALRGWYYWLKDGQCDKWDALALMKFMSDRFKVRGASIARGRVGKIRWQELAVEQPTASNWPVVLSKLPKVDYLEAIARNGGFSALLKPQVTLMSIHQSKGREAHTVIVDPVMTTRVNQGLLDRPDDEHRVWYVAVTRAKERLVLLLPHESPAYQW